jgi:tetratricopeptide (TPR) repeat protein
VSSLRKNLELGRDKLGHGDYLGALAQADAALVLDDTSFEALQLRSRALYLLGRDADALQTLRRAHAMRRQLSLDDSPLDASDDFAIPDDATMPGHTAAGSDALETLLALRERHALDADLLALLAELAEDAGRLEIAREAYDALVKADPQRLDGWEGLVHVLCYDDLDAALRIIPRALQLFPTHALFFEFLGFIHYHRRQYRQAIIAYRQAMAYGADHPDIYQALIECYLTLEEEPTALHLIAELAARGAQDADIHCFIIEVAIECMQYDLAMTHAHHLLRLQPSHAETYCYIAWVAIVQEDWNLAERTLRLGFHKAVDGGYALFELVEVLIVEEAYDDALRVAELALELAADHPESHASRGKILREMGMLTEALTNFQHAAELAPQDDAYQTWLGIVHDNLGEYPEALRYFNHVLSRHQTDVWTLANRGLTYLALEKPELALADFNRGIEIDPRDAPLYFWRACALVTFGEIDNAFRDLHRAVDFNDDLYAWLEQEPALAPLHDDPRYHELLQLPDLEG